MCGGGKSSGEVKETEDMIEQQKINVKLWNYYLSDYQPLVQKYTEMTTDEATQAAEEKQVAGKINAEVMKSVDPSKVSSNPVENTRMLTGLAKSGTSAQVQGEGGVRSRNIREIENVIDIGRGEAAEAQAGLSEIASQSVRAEISNKEIKEQEQAATEEAYGSVAGAIAAGLLRGTGTKTQSRTLMPREDLMNIQE